MYFQNATGSDTDLAYSTIAHLANMATGSDGHILSPSLVNVAALETCPERSDQFYEKGLDNQRRTSASKMWDPCSGLVNIGKRPVALRTGVR